LGVPLKQGDQVIGLMALANKAGGYDPADQEALETLASVLAEVLMRQQAENSLLRAMDYLEDVLENSVDGIGIVDAKGHFTRWNRSSAEMYGYEFEEIKEISAFDLYADKNELARMLD